MIGCWTIGGRESEEEKGHIYILTRLEDVQAVLVL